MPDRPTGTVTFLFTDIEGSTQLLQELGGDRYRNALETHRQLLRDVFRRHSGHEVDTQGDAFFVAFSRAQDAVCAAGEAQHALAAYTWPDGHELRIRMGIHTCEATATSEGYVGVGVHRGARICAAGHGGQVLLSHTTASLIEEEDTGFGAQDLGEHRLKDLTEPHRLFQLVDPTLPQDFPPLRTLENLPTNLPIQATPFVGREREVDVIVGVLGREGVRLVTLTGPGGTGKTRLAIQAAAELVEEFPNGVFLVALAPITDPQLVLPAVAQTLGVNEAAGLSLATYLATKKLLLVVDNFEQVIAAAPRLAELLTVAPDVRLLVTSREPLRLAAEHVYPVPPLDLPDPRHLPELSTLSQYEAVALFIERAQAARPSFELTSANAPAVAQICVRLDGLPLALELAAARMPLLSPDTMLRRLDDRLKLLRGGARDAPVRHQTLRDMLAWSHDLLNQDERQLFARLGVFVGGFTLEAAEAVGDAELDTLASLVDKNLIRREGERLGMLETIREFALERLTESGDAETIRRRHADYFLSVAQSANLTSEAEGEQRYDIIIPDRDNVRGALEWALQSGELELGLRLAVALEHYWVGNSPLEGKRWLGQLLDRSGELPGTVRAAALRAKGTATYVSGELEEGARLVEASLAEYRRAGDERGIAEVLHMQAMDALERGEWERARALQEESLRLHRKFKSKRGEALALRVFAELELQAGNEESALEQFDQSASAAGEAGFIWWQTSALLNLAKLLLERGRTSESEARVREALPLASGMGDRQQMIYALALLARLAVETGQPERAGRLWGAIEAEETRAPVGRWEANRDQYAQLLLIHAGPEFGRGRQEGARLSLKEAVDEVLDAVR
jgi:predicted ATPase/class 3 adenylate cyclase